MAHESRLTRELRALLQAHRVDDAVAANLVAPLSQGCPAAASSIHSAPYAAGFLVDGDSGTRWGTSDGDKDPWVEIDLGRKTVLLKVEALIEQMDAKIHRLQEAQSGDDAAEVKAIVYDGAIHSAGMPRMGDLVSEQDVADIQAYVIERSKQDRAAAAAAKN